MGNFDPYYHDVKVKRRLDPNVAKAGGFQSQEEPQRKSKNRSFIPQSGGV
jgi:hypothetical protein